MQYVNLTTEEVRLNDGRVFPPSGDVATVTVTFTDVVDDISKEQYGEVIGLPTRQGGQRFIVTTMVLDALNGTRDDVVIPAITHPKVIKDETGKILTIPCFAQ